MDVRLQGWMRLIYIRLIYTRLIYIRLMGCSESALVPTNLAEVVWEFRQQITHFFVIDLDVGAAQQITSILFFVFLNHGKHRIHGSLEHTRRFLFTFDGIGLTRTTLAIGENTIVQLAAQKREKQRISVLSVEEHTGEGVIRVGCMGRRRGRIHTHTRPTE